MRERPTHAGAVVFRRDADGIRYLLVSSSDEKYWVLPKGRIEREDATPVAAAERELREEAGVEGEPIDEDLCLRRFRKLGAEVRVQYFLVEATGSTEAAEQRSLLWISEAEVRHLNRILEDTRDVLLEAASALRQREGTR